MKTRIKEILPGMAVAFCICFMLLIYAPLELYITNQADFWFTAGQLLPTALLMFASAFVLTAAVLLICRRTGKKVYDAVFALEVLVFICCFVQGNYMVKNLPVMNGTPVDWAGNTQERLKSAALWVAAAVLVIVLLKVLGSKKFRVIGTAVCAAMTLILMITIGTLFLTTPQSDKGFSLAFTDKDMLTMSENENFIIFLIDSVDGTEFEKVIDSHDEYREVFKDFTFYDNAVSGYPFTKCSVPLILTGQWYEVQEWFDDYAADALETSPFMQKLKERNYSRGIYCDDPFFLQEDRFEGEFVNLVKDTPVINSGLFKCKMLLKMAIVKYAPWDLKYLGYDLPGRVKECRELGKDLDYDYFIWDNDLFYNRFRDENPVITEERNCFKYYHLKGAHTPYIYDKELNVVEESSYEESIEGSIMLCGKYLELLRENGLYDDAVVVIMSDHGSGEQTESLQWHHPILLAKGRGESHELRVSSAPISWDDLQQAFLKLLDGAGSDEIFDWHEGDERERRFMDLDWSDVKHIEEYIQTGDAGDMETIVPTGRVFE